MSVGNLIPGVPFLKKVSYPIKIPTDNKSKANKVFNSDPWSLWPIFCPECTPAIDPAISIITRTKSIVWKLKAWEIVTKPVINIVTNKEVPGTNLGGMPIKYIIAGTIKNAPPTPIIAAMKPTTSPKMIGTKALSYTLEVLNFVLKGNPCIQ